MTDVFQAPLITPQTAPGQFRFEAPARFSSLPTIGDMPFDAAMAIVAMQEGLFSNDPNDAGGPTKYGWTLKAARQYGLEFDIDHDGDVDIDDIKALQPLQAVQAYYKHFWLAPYRQLPDQVAIKVFSLAVNMYPKQAHILLQRAVRACATPLTEDGILGPQSVAAVNSVYQPAMLAALRSEAAGFYRSLVAQDKKFQPFINGWLNRAYY